MSQVYDKHDVLEKSEPVWIDIITSLTGIDRSIFNPRKEHPCPCCGGKTRFRYRIKSGERLDRPFFCNHCGSKSGINLLMDLTGLDFFDAINKVGDHLSLIPVEKLEIKQAEYKILTQFPEWYKFDQQKYLHIKNNSNQNLTSWQRLSGLGMLDVFNYDNHAVIDIMDINGVNCDVALIDINGSFKTSSDNTMIPLGFYSVFGNAKGKNNYIAVDPYYAAHASVFTGKLIYCAYSVENIWEIAKSFDEDPIIIVSSLEEVEEADSLKFKQITFDKKNKRVNRKLWEPGEIIKEKLK